MPYVLIADEGVSCLFIRYSPGSIDADLREAINAVADDPSFQRLPGRLHDFRAIEESISSDELRDVAALGRKRACDLGAPRRTAVLVPSDLQFGQARMYQAYSDDLERSLRVFRDFEGAARWLDLPCDYADPFPADDD